MKLLVYEHISGGGLADESIPSNVLGEGFGMLRTLISDYKNAGHRVITTLDSRIASLNPFIDADYVKPTSSSRDAQINLCRLSEDVDATCIIAPETGGLLKSLVNSIEETGVASLNSSSSAIEKISDKAQFCDSLRKLEVPFPETIIFKVDDDVEKITRAVRNSLNFPCIFKPSNATSCCGLSVAANEEQIAAAVSKIRNESSSNHFLVQKLINGVAASVSLFSTGSNVIAVSLNRQDVRFETPGACSSYRGGLVPFDYPLRSGVFKVAEKIIRSIEGLMGYLGVDFVLTKDEALVIEVNPRLTTSYVGLRGVANFNLAQAIINAVLKHKLPTQIQNCGYTYFSIVDMPKPTVSAFQKTSKMDTVISPPFPFSNNDAASALIASQGSTLKEAESRFREAKKRVINTINRSK